VEVFGDDVNLLLRLGWKRRKRWCFVDSDGSRLGGVLLGIAIGGVNVGGEFRSDLSPESIRFLVSK